MSMDTSAIEKYAVNAVEDRINLSDYLSTFIADNDKEPSWDGNIYIYRNASKKKANLCGRIPVQVKGTENSDFSKPDITFQMDVSDLRNYLNDGGAVLFVVYVRKQINEIKTEVENKVYYRELTPIQLMLILSEMKEAQESISVSLKTLPYNPVQVATILLNCSENCTKQASFAGVALPSLEELEQKGMLEGISIPVSGYGIDLDYVGAFLSNETYLYAKVPGCPALIPLECAMESR